MKKGGLFSPFGITQLVMIAAVGAALWLAHEPWRWSKVRDSLRDLHPGAAQIDATTLANWITNPDNQQPLLLDLRTPDEFEASHIANARNVSAADVPEGLGQEMHADLPIVVYCPVGTQSADVVSGLQRRGYKRVQYLEGGIFLWANKDKPLVNKAGPTTKVAPGNSPYADLLKRKHRAL